MVYLFKLTNVKIVGCSESYMYHLIVEMGIVLLQHSPFPNIVCHFENVTILEINLQRMNGYHNPWKHNYCV